MKVVTENLETFTVQTTQTVTQVLIDTLEHNEIENVVFRSFMVTALELTPRCYCLLQSSPSTIHSTCPPTQHHHVLLTSFVQEQQFIKWSPQPISHNTHLHTAVKLNTIICV